MNRALVFVLLGPALVALAVWMLTASRGVRPSIIGYAS